MASSTVQAPASTPIPPASAPRLHLRFLDGIRGLAAIYVLLYHLVERDRDLPALAHNATAWMHFGHFAVAVFIVLSGYCLMLPVARSAGFQLRGGVQDYLKRRARRILPPYYAALLLSIAFLAASHLLKRHAAAHDSGQLANLTAGALASHLTLIHNLSLQWVWAINIPMWSVATEWQIYFVFPLLLVLCRRAGPLTACAFALAAGVLPHVLLPAGRNLDWACPWYLGLFAVGMAGAVVAYAERGVERAMRDRVPWGLVAALLAAGFCALPKSAANFLPYNWMVDTLAGIATLCLILACTRLAGSPTGARHPAMRLLEARPIVLLGEFSYSLYLTHILVVWTISPMIQSRHLAPALAMLARLAVGVPLALAAAYLFHLVFERRFMPGHAPAAREPAKLAVVSAAQ